MFLYVSDIDESELFPKRYERAAINQATALWPDAKVPYYLDERFCKFIFFIE